MFDTMEWALAWIVANATKINGFGLREG